MSYNGYRRATTPYIDEFARDSVMYRRAHSVAPWTLPSHMSMFTGLLPGQHGATWRAFSTPENMNLEQILSRSIALADPERLLPVRLRRLGYTTVGLSNNAWVARRTGFNRGFDAFYEMWTSSRAIANGYGWLPPRIRISPDVDKGDAGLTLVKFRQHVLGRGLPEPFFLFVNFIDPHFPYSPPALWRYAFSNDLRLGERIARFGFSEISLAAGDRPVDVAAFTPFYDAEMSYLDFVVGRLLIWLRENGYYDESLIIITSDHGEHLGEGGRFSHQFSVEEELLQVPLLIRYPGGSGRGTVVDNPLVSNIDAYETALRVAAGHQPSTVAASTSSRDLRDMGAFDRRYLIAEYDYSLPYLRLHHERYAGFSIDANRVVRRVVYDREGRYAFVEHNGSSQASLEASPEGTARAQAAAFLEQYVKSLSGGMLRQTTAPVDKETLERLRSLGYAR